MSLNVHKFVAALVLALAVASCAPLTVSGRIDHAGEIAKAGNLHPIVVETPHMKLFGYGRVAAPGAQAVLYIEGDGFAFVERTRASTNPTPRNPIGLKLAAQDQSANVIYLGRPCQYVVGASKSGCDSRLWTSHRFSAAVVDMYDKAIEQINRKFRISVKHLVGYSGGGAIAALVAARRKDIHSLRTIAGNLDHESLYQVQRLTPLNGSLNPISFAWKLKYTPQLHYSGANDEVIPGWVGAKFVKAQQPTRCAIHRLVPVAAHADYWVEAWRQLSRTIPKC